MVRVSAEYFGRRSAVSIVIARENFLKGADDVLLILIGQVRRNRQQNGSFEQAISNGTRAFAIFRTRLLVLCQGPGRISLVQTGLLYQAGNVVVDMQTPLCHDNVV